MKRKYKRRTSRFGIFFVFLTAVTIRELMDNGELEYVQNGNRRLIADTAIWDWYERAKTAVKPPAEQGG